MANILFTSSRQLNLDAIKLSKVSLHANGVGSLSKPTCYVKLEFINVDPEFFEWEQGKEIIRQLHEFGFYSDNQYNFVIDEYEEMAQDLRAEIEAFKQSHQK